MTRPSCGRSSAPRKPAKSCSPWLDRTAPSNAVAISPPVYPPFFDWVPEAGGRLLEVPLTADFRLDLGRIEAAFATHPAAYVLCSPHNPVGLVHPAEQLRELSSILDRHGGFVVSDEKLELPTGPRPRTRPDHRSTRTSNSSCRQTNTAVLRNLRAGDAQSTRRMCE